MLVTVCWASFSCESPGWTLGEPGPWCLWGLWFMGAGVAELEMAVVLPPYWTQLSRSFWSSRFIAQDIVVNQHQLWFPGGAALQLLLLIWSHKIWHFGVLWHTIYIWYLSDTFEYWNSLGEGETRQKLAHQKFLSKMQLWCLQLGCELICCRLHSCVFHL